MRTPARIAAAWESAQRFDWTLIWEGKRARRGVYCEVVLEDAFPRGGIQVPDIEAVRMFNQAAQVGLGCFDDAGGIPHND